MRHGFSHSFSAIWLPPLPEKIGNHFDIYVHNEEADEIKHVRTTDRSVNLIIYNDSIYNITLVISLCEEISFSQSFIVGKLLPYL